MNPLFSVITASYNSEKTIKETITSVLNQNYTNFEYIIIDGNSTDNTVNIIREFEPIFKQKNISYKWISEKDSGIYNAWNKGLKLAIGNWIAFLGSDDIYLEKSLEKYAKIAISNPEADLITSKVKLINNNNKVKHIFSKPWRWNEFKRNMKIAHVGSFHNKKYFEKYGIYNETYKITGDYELLLRAKDKLKPLFINEFTAEMKDGGVSNNFVIKAFKEAKRAKIEAGEVNPFIASIEFIFSLLKYYISRLIK
ncbi:hypothetical protein WH52_13235 [Tenacibaculum holothuriorum]|uniref:Glycosyltransferase 2-like domain-containing protein n=1 Tax=Tenacibaculum holothuriorum TaxID=1635173 RepID=A0A1Y2P9A4_9FLAO|nr:glycosyltransferase family 2 protein [Tenacibaculum holothuriorum]OSY87023.1 hypothetical protein WH52_13235 [Tenacibaculum holothuriorum]